MVTMITVKWLHIFNNANVHCFIDLKHMSLNIGSRIIWLITHIWCDVNPSIKPFLYHRETWPIIHFLYVYGKIFNGFDYSWIFRHPPDCNDVNQAIVFSISATFQSDCWIGCTHCCLKNKETEGKNGWNGEKEKRRNFFKRCSCKKWITYTLVLLLYKEYHLLVSCLVVIWAIYRI